MRKDHTLNGCFNIQELMQRGWTCELIEQYLGEPIHIEEREDNREVLFYSKSKVQAIESCPHWNSILNAYKPQRKKVVQKAKKVKEYVADIVESSQAAPLIIIEEKAKEDYVSLTNKEIFSDNDEGFIRRITVNYIRHKLSPYDSEIKRISKNPTYKSDYNNLVKQIYNAISRVYPELYGECQEQIDYRINGNRKVLS